MIQLKLVGIALDRQEKSRTQVLITRKYREYNTGDESGETSD